MRFSFAVFPWLLASSLGAAGCGLVEYEPEPLDVAAVLESLQDWRERAATQLEGQPLALSDAELLGLERDPAFRQQLAVYRGSLALVDVKTPFADPTLSVGANGVIGPGVNRRRVGVPSLGGSLAIPLTRRRGRQDARDAALVSVEAARCERVARVTVLKVRSTYAEAVMAGEQLQAREGIADIARGLAVAAEALVQTGNATALDLSLLRLEATLAEQALFDAEVDARTARAALASALMLGPSELDDVPLVGASEEWISGLTERLAGDDPEVLARTARTDLATLAASYGAAEAELALQIARQVKDINLGASISPEPAEAFTIVGLALSSALPLFQRNAQAIATAFADRQRLGVSYGIALDRISVEVQASFAAVTRAEAKRAFVEEQVVPATDAVTRAAEAGVGAGAASALSLLAATRSRADVALKQTAARHDVVRAWLRVESVVEAPRLGFGAQRFGEWSEHVNLIMASLESEDAVGLEDRVEEGIE